jgi:hypothetical protein
VPCTETQRAQGHCRQQRGGRQRQAGRRAGGQRRLPPASGGAVVSGINPYLRQSNCDFQPRGAARRPAANFRKAMLFRLGFCRPGHCVVLHEVSEIELRCAQAQRGPRSGVSIAALATLSERLLFTHHVAAALTVFITVGAAIGAPCSRLVGEAVSGAWFAKSPALPPTRSVLLLHAACRVWHVGQTPERRRRRRQQAGPPEGGRAAGWRRRWPRAP